MLFMTVYTFEPSQRDDVIRRRVEKGALIPAGMKMIGEWSAAGGGRVFRLIEVDDPTAMFEATTPWTDIGKLEVYPVIEVEKVLPYLAEKVTAAAAR